MNKEKLQELDIDKVFSYVTNDEITRWFEKIKLLSEKEIEDLKHGLKINLIEVIKKFYEDETTRSYIYKRIIEEFSRNCAVAPKLTEEILGCTTSERKRWEEEEKIKVAYYFDAGTRRKPVSIPMYDRMCLENLNDDILERWRADHKAEIALSRKTHEKVKINSRLVTVRAYCVGLKVEKIFGPVMVLEDDLENHWTRYKEKTPFNMEDKECTIIMEDELSHEVLGIERKEKYAK